MACLNYILNRINAIYSVVGNFLRLCQNNSFFCFRNTPAAVLRRSCQRIAVSQSRGSQGPELAAALELHVHSPMKTYLANQIATHIKERGKTESPFAPRL